jgi:jumonji domain-containing protein 2
VTYRPSVEEMGELPNFISNSVEKQGDEIGGFSVIPPFKTPNTFGDHICKPCVHPLRQDYVKLEEGVYRREAVKIRGSGLGRFMAKNYMASLSKSGFGSLGPDGQNWKGFYYLFDEVEKGNGTTPNKLVPEYLVDKNVSIFEEGESSW